MIEQTNKPWYVARRGELLAEEFLLELGPLSLSRMQDAGLGVDYMAFFQKTDGTLVVIAVEVKATQQDISGRYSLSSSTAQRLLNMNIPVLVIVVDVKDNLVYFNWIDEALSEEQRALLKSTQSCRINLRLSTPEELKRLRQEITQQQPESKGSTSSAPS